MESYSEKEIKEMLRSWGDGGVWIMRRSNEYDRIKNMYTKGERDGLVSEKELFGFRSMAEEVFRDVRSFMYKRNKLEKALDKLDNIERAVINCRYAKKIKWVSVPAHMPVAISLRQCQRVHKEALKKLAGYMEQDE